ncbi:MAG: hypothetical protein EBZ77_06520, partial [Chitinophagia bacterium]|nr:hypothetical protein [Chitinophagia bacterium]
MNILRTLGALILLTSLALTAMAQRSYPTVFETSGGKQSAVYDSIIAYYDRLDDNFKTIKVTGCGFADGGQLMRVVYYSADERFDTAAWHREGKLIILINNGIHAGEPDGIDASMMLLRDIAMGKVTMPDNVVLAIIPTFNIGGTLNRNSRSRANQNGPLEYGFRGNAANLDLNRDFMKADASETRSLQRLFTALDPDVFIDNHVSDGADYQHIMTLLPTQHDKLGGACGHYLYNTFTPAIYRRMKKAGYDLVPYVNNFDNTPERGWVAFYEPPRFASGYAALFQCFGFVVETHMLKPFAQRVTATYQIVKD